MSIAAFSFSAAAQAADEVAVTKVVETYLNHTDAKAIEQLISPQARIYSIDLRNDRVIETPLKRPAKKTKAEIAAPRQTIDLVEITGSAAVVKVRSVFPGAESIVHFQFISLLKISGQWKIVSILMPAFEPVRM